MFTVCVAGRYGQNCMQACGYCANNVPCNPVTEKCPGGCAPGYKGTGCQHG